MELLALGLVIGIILHKIWTHVMIAMTLREMKRNGIDLQEIFQDAETKNMQEPEMITARLEQHNGTFLLYDTNTSEFIAQGMNAAEIEHQVNVMRPNHSVIVTDSDPEVLNRYRETKTVNA